MFRNRQRTRNPKRTTGVKLPPALARLKLDVTFWQITKAAFQHGNRVLAVQQRQVVDYNPDP
jgi:hypothetical protein